MYILFVVAASLYALTNAAPDQIVRRQDPAIIASVFSRISSLGAELLPPPTLVPQLTGIPASVTSALFNTALQSSLASEFLDPNGPPAWFTSLRPDAKAYILRIPGREATILSQIISIEVAAGFPTLLLPPAPAPVLATTTDSSATSVPTSNPDISTTSDVSSLNSVVPSNTTSTTR